MKRPRGPLSRSAVTPSCFACERGDGPYSLHHLDPGGCGYTPQRPPVASESISGPGVGQNPEVVFTQAERQFEREVIRYAESMGWLIHKDRATNAPRLCPCCKKPLRIPRNDPGFPDLVMVRAGRVVWAELKSERGKPTKDQLCWLRALWKAGEECFVWRPSDWETIAKVLR